MLTALLSFVKPARLRFARTARALRGDLSEFLAARTCASYWFDKRPYAYCLIDNVDP